MSRWNIHLLLRKPKNPHRRETLERMKRWPGLRDPWQNKSVMIYSKEHHAYWRTGGNGYTEKLIEAGVWSFVEAFQLTRHCGPDKKIEFYVSEV